MIFNEKGLARRSEKDKVICYQCGNKDATTFYWLASNLWCERCGGMGIEPFMSNWEQYNKKYSKPEGGIMGVFNSYSNKKISVQLKIGINKNRSNLCLKNFKIGEKVDIKDGIYVGHEGFVCIKNGILVAVERYITSKWGHKILSKKVISLI